MTTLYSEIYSRFMSKIEDYDLVNSIQLEPQYYEETVLDFLVSSIPKFTHCNKDLSNRDDTLKQFNITLSELEKEILANMMVFEYLSPKILRTDLLEQRLGSKDMANYSPANHMKEVRELRNTAKNEILNLITDYYYSEGFNL